MTDKISCLCIIEDDPIQIFIQQNFVNKTGLVEELLIFKNGSEAMEGLKQRASFMPEVIFLDLNMPIWDGWIFLSEFQKLPRSNESAVYILTSSANFQDSEKAKEFQLEDRLLLKPLSFESLVDILTAHLRKA